MPKISTSLRERLDLVEGKLSSFKIPQEIKEIKELITEINQIKSQKNVVVLGHNYMGPEVYYGVSDYTGDSFGLAQNAASTNADIILFNGVHFMAETAKILNPNKKVLIADPEAGCSLAESIKREDVIELKEQNPEVPVVSYINCSAEIKAESDIICTSANAAKIINSFENDTIIMLPDRYLAENVQRQTGKNIISWNGKCMVHELFTEEDISLGRQLYPDVHVVSHPECKPEVTGISEFSGSTSKMASYIEDSGAEKVMLLTECSMGENLKVEFPDVEFVSTCQNCPHMKKITLEKILISLQEEKHEIEVPWEVADKARVSLQRMLEIGRN